MFLYRRMMRFFFLILTLSLTLVPLRADLKTPQLTYLFPMGAQRGATVEVAMGGQYLQEATQIHIDGKGITASIGKSAANILTTRFCVAPETEPGSYEVRVQTPNGLSNTLLFSVGALKEINESEPNNEIAKANPITPPVTINGKIEGGEDQDYFLVRAQAGERLLFDLDATRSGSPLDASLTLFDKNGRELYFNEDFYTWDPFIDYTFPQAGEYLVRVRGIAGRSSADFTYRLNIHALPYLANIFPLGARRGTALEATVVGRLLRKTRGAPLHLTTGAGAVTGPPSGERATVRLNIRSDAPLGPTEIRLQTGEILSNAVRFDISDWPEAFESEPNDQPAQANTVAWPVMINGQLNKRNDADHFKFTAKKGERLFFEVRAHQLGSPVDAVLTLLDAKGRELASNDDPVAPSFNEPANWDAKLAYKFQADGEYVIQIRDVTGQGGEGFPYRLLIRAAQPAFTLKITPENPVVEQGQEQTLAVSLVREEGFEGEVELFVHGLPPGVHESGQLKIGAKANKTTIELHTAEQAPTGITPIRIVGRATFEDKAIEQAALGVIKLPRVSGQDVLRMSRQISLSVVEPPPFVLEIKPERLSLKLGQTAAVKVKALRRAGFHDAIQLSMTGLPKGLSLQPVLLNANESEIELSIQAAPNAAKGNVASVVLTGAAEVKGRKLSEQAPSIALNVQ